MKKSELKDKAAGELQKLEKDLIETARNIRFEQVVGSLSNPARIKIVRRDIARVKTELRERQLLEDYNKLVDEIQNLADKNDIKKILGTRKNPKRRKLVNRHRSQVRALLKELNINVEI